MRIAVNKRKSTSLVAGVCTVCIAATGAAQPPVTPDHHESAMRMVSQEVALTAATGNRLVDIAALPFQNYFTIASTLGQLAAFVPPVNAATGAFLQGNFAPIPALLQKAFIDEMNAIAAVVMLPATIIAYDLGVIFGPPTAANTTLATRAAAASAGPSTGNPWLDVSQLPFQNYFTIASTLGQLAAFVPPVNAATGAFFQGNFAPIQGLLTKAFNDELAAINNVLKLPGEIISYDLSVIGRAVGTVHAPLNTTMSSIERDALSATLATFADKNADAKKPDVIDGEVVSVQTTIGDPADVGPAAVDPSDEDKKDADKTGDKDAPTTGADATGAPAQVGKKFSDEVGKKYEEVTGKKFSDLIGKKDPVATGKKDADTAGAIRHAISNATGKKKADKHSASNSAAE